MARLLGLKRWQSSIIALFMLFTVAAQAAIDTYEFDDPVMRKRFHSLADELRCPKCQNNNLADSNSPIAEDLRRQVYRMLQDGRTDTEIVDYMVARYGEFVRYKPAFAGATLVLWLAPVGFLLLGLILVIYLLRRQSGVEQATDLDTQEQDKLRQILQDKSNS